MGLTSEAEAQVLPHSVGLLVLARREQPGASPRTSVRSPATRRADGAVVVGAAFDAVYGLQTVADGEQSLRELPPDEGVAHREFWFEGGVSAHAREELMRRGWCIREDAGRSAE